MDELLPLLLGLLLSRRELRFEAVPEQSDPSGCGRAVAAALLSPGAPAPPGDGALDLGSLALLLEEGGLRVKPMRLGPEGLEAASARGLLPAVLHYGRPSPHWALLLAARGGLYALGDPARGLEVLEGGELRLRWSGAAILLDPAAIDPGFLRRAAEAADRGFARYAMLQGEGVAPPPRAGASPPPRLRLGLALEERAAGEELRLEGDLGLRLASGGASLGLGLPLAARLGAGAGGWGLGAPVLDAAWAGYLAPWVLSAALEVRSPRGPGPGSSLSPRLVFGLARILDPVAAGLELSGGLVGGGAGGLGWGLEVSAIEAISERFSLRLAAGLEARSQGRGFGLESRLSLVAGYGGGNLDLGFGWLEEGGGAALLMKLRAGGDLPPSWAGER